MLDEGSGKGGGQGDDHKISLSVIHYRYRVYKLRKRLKNAIVNVTGNGYLTGQGIADSIKSINSLRNYAKKQGFTADTAAAATKVHMPTALVISGDYQIYNHFYANVTYIGNLVNRQLFGNSYYSQFTVTPHVMIPKLA